MRGMIIVLFSILLFACNTKQEENALRRIQPKVVEAKGYVVPKDSMAAPKVIPVDESKLKKIPVGKPKVVPTNTNVHPAGQPRVIAAGIPRVCTPGKDGFALPKEVPAIDSPFVAVQPKAIMSMPLSMKENAICNIQNIDIDQGLPSSMVMCALEDKRGNIWFGTWKGGVSKYDGKMITSYTLKEGLSGNTILSMLEDRAGNLWFGTEGGGVTKFDGIRFSHFTSKDGLGSNYIQSIFEDNEGNIWLGTWDSGVTRFDGKNFTQFTKDVGFIGNQVWSILQDKNGNLWFGTRGDGLCKYDGKVFSHFTEMEGLPSNVVFSIIEDKIGNLWIASMGGGVSKYDGMNFTQFTKKEGLCSDDICCIQEDMKGNLWFGSWNGGITCYNGNLLEYNIYAYNGKESLSDSLNLLKTFVSYSNDDFLSNNIVQSILEDKVGNLWFCTFGGGVSVYHSVGFKHFFDTSGLPSNEVWSVTEDKYGNIWFGTPNGVSKYDEKSFSSYSDKEGLSSNYVRCTLEDRMGNLWFGTSGGGVSKFDGKTFTHYTKKDGLCSNEIYSMEEDENGNLWYGSYYEGVSKFDGNRFTTYTERQGLMSNCVMSILGDKNGSIWFGSPNGVTRYDGVTFTQYSDSCGLNGFWVNSILEDKNGNKWFALSDGVIGIGGGVSKYDGKFFTFYSENQGIISDKVRCFSEDHDGRLWISTDKGLSVFNAQNSQVLNFNKFDGLMSETIDATFSDSKNRIWLLTVKGLSMIRTSDLSNFNQTPSLELRNITLQGEVFNFKDIKNGSTECDRRFQQIVFDDMIRFQNVPLNMKLPYDIDDIRFEFIATDWSAPDKLRYSYMLVGQDVEWSHPSKENFADYRNLPSGAYTFKVKAIGISEHWSEPFNYTFTIRPPWWLTFWAYAAYAIFIVGSIFSYIRWRERSLRARQKELEFKVDEATGVIRKQKEVVEEKNREILDSIEYAKRIQTAILPPPRIVKSFLKDSFILYLPKDIVAGDFYWMDSMDDTIYFAACDCTGHGVPGALVSVVCNNALNRSVNEFTLRKPGAIFDKTRELVIENFVKSDEDVKDGMDASLCALSFSPLRLQWSGANNPLWVYRAALKSIEEIKADKQPIGKAHEPRPFATHEVALHHGDTIYLFTDGYADQFGGTHNKKLTRARFRELLLSIAHLPMDEQREKLLEHHSQYRGTQEQIDDICVMGVRV